MNQQTLLIHPNQRTLCTHKCANCKKPYTNNLQALDCCYYAKVEKVLQ